MGGIFDVAEKTDHVTQPVHQHGQLPYNDATEEDDHQRQPCEIAHCQQKYFTPALAALRKGVNFLGIFAKWMLTELACSNIILIDVTRSKWSTITEMGLGELVMAALN